VKHFLNVLETILDLAIFVLGSPYLIIYHQIPYLM
jgi:hypothetical protein